MSSSLHVGGPRALCPHSPTSTKTNPTQQSTSFFTMLPSTRGTKRQIDSSIASESKPVWARGTIPLSQRHERHSQTRSLTNRQTRSPRHQQWGASKQQRSRRSISPPKLFLETPFYLGLSSSSLKCRERWI
jgi:hypothetical protein